MLKVDCTVELDIEGFTRVVATKTMLVERDYVGNQKDVRVLTSIIDDELDEGGYEKVSVERIIGYSAECVDCGLRVDLLTDRCECFGQEVAA